MAERNVRHDEKKEMWKNGNEGNVVMREYDYDNTRDDEKARGYLPPGLRGAVGKDSPRPDEDNRLLSCLLMKPGIRITQDCADPCRGMSTQEPVESKKCVEAWPRPADFPWARVWNGRTHIKT